MAGFDLLDLRDPAVVAQTLPILRRLHLVRRTDQQSRPARRAGKRVRLLSALLDRRLTLDDLEALPLSEAEHLGRSLRYWLLLCEAQRARAA